MLITFMNGLTMVKRKLDARDGGLDIHQERILRALQNGKELTLADLAREEAAELDRLLARVDQLTLVKARARYTLHRQRAGASPAQSETQS